MMLLAVVAATCLQAETTIHYNDEHQSKHNAVLDVSGSMQTAETVSSAVKTTIDTNAKVQLVLTRNTARVVSKLNPQKLVLALMLEQTTRRSESPEGLAARCTL
eukprot:jgi/Phyca11/16203/fgenesh1_pg.PHYCAscaffold_18_\